MGINLVVSFAFYCGFDSLAEFTFMGLASIVGRPFSVSFSFVATVLWPLMVAVRLASWLCLVLLGVTLAGKVFYFFLRQFSFEDFYYFCEVLPLPNGLAQSLFLLIIVFAALRILFG